MFQPVEKYIPFKISVFSDVNNLHPYSAAAAADREAAASATAELGSVRKNAEVGRRREAQADCICV